MEKEIEVIAICIKTGCITKKIMSEVDWYAFQKKGRKTGYNYIPYQKGFSQFSEIKKNNNEKVF